MKKLISALAVTFVILTILSSIGWLSKDASDKVENAKDNFCSTGRNFHSS